MTLSAPVRSILLGVVLIAVSAAGALIGQNKYGQPKSVIHVVALKWKTESTPEQRQKAIDGIKTMADKIPGIKNIWTKPIRVQPPEYNANFAIEFVDEAAAKAYADHPAHKEWDAIYQVAREESRSNQVTN